MNDHDRDWKEWIRKGDEDHLNIDNNLNAAITPWATVIYHAQQAAEKYLKAFLASRNVLPKRTHNLQILLEECSKLDNVLISIENDCRDLDYLSDDIRYPGIPNDSEEEMARQAVSAYERICRAVLQKLDTKKN